MTASWIQKITGDLAQKKRYRAHITRMKSLPSGYDEVYFALERYVFVCGGLDDGTADALQDLGKLLERSASDGLPITSVVGAEPVDFIENFLENYARGKWIVREQDRLNAAIALAS